MGDKKDLQIKIGADAAAARDELRRVSGSMDDLRAANMRTASSGDRLRSSFDSIRAAAAPLATALAALVSVRAFKDVIAEGERLERNLLRTQKIVESTGKAAGFSARELHQQARELAFATLQSTEGIMEAQQIMLGFRKVTAETFVRSQELALDLAAVLKTDLSTAMTQLGRVLDNPTQNLNILNRSGIAFTQTQQDMIASLWETGRAAEAQAVILDALAGKYGGVARAEAAGLAGALDTLGQQLQEAKQELYDYADAGARSATLVNGAAEMVASATQALQRGDLDGTISLLKTAVELLAIAIGSRLAAALVTSAAQTALATAEAIRYQAALARMAGLSRTAAAGQVALSGAVAGARGAMALLGGPAGVAILAATAIYHFRHELGLVERPAAEAESAVRSLTEGIEDLTRAQAEARLGAALDEYTKSAGEAERIAAQIAATALELKALRNRPFSVMNIGTQDVERVHMLQAALIDLNSEYDTAQQRTEKLKEIMGQLQGIMGRAAGVATGAGAEAAAEVTTQQLRAQQRAADALAKYRRALLDAELQHADGARAQELAALELQYGQFLLADQDYLTKKHTLEAAAAQDRTELLRTEARVAAQAVADAAAAVQIGPSGKVTGESAQLEAYYKALTELTKVRGQLEQATAEQVVQGLEAALELYQSIVAEADRLLALEGQTHALRADNAMLAADLVGGASDDLGDVYARQTAQLEARYQREFELVDEKMKLIEQEKKKAGANFEQQEAHAAQLAALSKKQYLLDKKQTVEQERLNRDYIKGKMALAGQYAGYAGGMLSALADTQDQTSRSGFESAKNMQMAAAVVNTAGAIMNALATVQPYPAAIGAAAVAAATGAAQISKIQSTSFGSGDSSFSLPSAAGGGGGGGYAAQVGTVLGAPEQQSESTSRVLDLLDSIHSKEYRELRTIAYSMQDLNANITGLVNSIVRGTAAGGGVLEGVSLGGTVGAAESIASSIGTFVNRGFVDIEKMLGDTLGSIFAVASLPVTILGDLLGGLAKGIFGGGTETKLKGQGFDIAAISAQQIMDGADAYVQEYAYIKKHKKGGWFKKGSSSYSYLYEQADSDITDLFTKILGNLSTSVTQLASGLGGVEAETAAMRYRFNIGKIDLKDMDSEEISKTLAAVISAQADLYVDAILGPLVKQYQKVDEGLMETASRLLVSKAIVVDSFEKIGKSYTWAESSLMRTAEGAIAVTTAIAEAAGGVEQYQKTFENFFDLFFSDAEKQASRSALLRDAFSDLGLALPVSRQAYRDMAAAMDVSTEAGRRAYVQLLELADQAGAYYDYLGELANSRFDLEMQVLELTGREAEALAQQRSKELVAMDVSLRPLQQRVWALEDEARAAEESQRLIAEAQSAVASAENELRTAYSRNASELGNTISKFGQFSVSLGKFREQLSLSDSPLSASQREAAAARRFADVAGRAQLGDADAMSELQAASQSYLDTSKAGATSAEDYYRSLAQVQAGLRAAEETADRTVGNAQLQLDALEQQVAALIDINDSVLSVADAVTALHSAIAAASAVNVPGFASGGYHSGGLRLVGENGPELEATGPSRIYTAAQTQQMLRGSGNRALIAEIRALRSEVIRLRAEAAATARNTHGTRRQLERWDGDGMPEERAM
ncbi:MAG: hypothetical protein RBR06_06055 [Desulfuromonadaceae bacterium]|nr:hypothetical protein [Desulfuromonadaceae bacterium]